MSATIFDLTICSAIVFSCSRSPTLRRSWVRGT